eukprot:gene3358-6649_t
MDTIQLQSDMLQRDVVEVSDYTKVVDNTKLLQEASCLDHLLWSSIEEQGVSDWIRTIITSATSEWQHRLKALNETISDTILPNTATSTFLRLDRMVPLENLIATIVRGDLKKLIISITNALVEMIQFNDVKEKASKLKLFLTNIISWMEFLPSIEKSVSFSSEDRMALLKFVPLLTSKKRDVITNISKLLKEIKDKAHEAFLARDCSIVHENLDLLHEYIILDEFLDPKATVIYEELKSFLRLEINLMSNSANNYVSNGELDKASEIKTFFENASLFASHFPDYDFNSTAQDLLGKHREAADKIYDEIQILLSKNGNHFDTIRDKMRNLLQAEGDTYWDPKNKSIYENCDKLLSNDFRKLSKRASDCESKEDEDAIESLFTLLEKCDGAIDLTGMVTYDPKHVLTNIDDVCNTVYNRIEGNIKRNLSKFKFRVASKLFDVIKRFNQMDVFSSQWKRHLTEEIRIDFKQRTEALLTNQILNLNEHLMNTCREFLMYNDLNNKDSMDFHEPNFDKLNHLLDNIVIADASDHALFNDKVDFQEIKVDIVNLIFEYSQNIDHIVRDFIFKEDFEKAAHFHDYMNSVRNIADKFMTPTKASKIRQQCERQAQDIIQPDIIQRFSFSYHEIEKFAIDLDKLRRNNYTAYKQSLANFSTRLHEEYKNFEKYISHPEIIALSDKNLSNAFEFIRGLWEYECRIGCQEDFQIQKLCSNSNDQFNNFLSERFFCCSDLLHQGENVEAIKQELSKMIKITTEALEALDTCKNLIEIKCQDATSTTSSYLITVLNNISNRQQILKTCEQQCHILKTEALSKINKLVEHEESMKKYNLFDIQNMEEIIPILDSLGKQTRVERPKRSLFDMNSEMNNSSHGPQEIFQNIEKQLHESILKVQSLLLSKDYSTLAVGVYNIQQLEKSTVLKSTCIDINKRIFTIVQDAYAQLLHNFDTAFRHNNARDVDKIVQEAEAWDKAFTNLSDKFEPLMEKVKAEFALVMDQSIDRDKGNATTVDDHASNMVNIKAFVDDISSKDIQQLAHHRIGRYIETLSLEKMDLFALGTSLANLGPLGVLITEEYSQFKSVLTKKFNEATANITIDHALNELDTKNPNIFTASKKDMLKDMFRRYETTFEGFLKTYLHGYGSSFSSQPLEYLVQHILTKSKSFSNKFDLVDLLAGVFAVWTILTSKDMYKETNDRCCLIKPHTIQLIAIFCLMGLDTKDGVWSTFSNSLNSFAGGKIQPTLDGHLIQVGTGEGKSILLGGLSCLLAIFGYEVSCASYSKYLSNRDYEAFRELFELFEVDENIEYSTLSDLMESVINRNGNIRDLTERRLFKPSSLTSKCADQSKSPSKKSKKSLLKKKNSTKRILLIDEVDVFFSKDFFGATYNPIAQFKSDEMIAILTHIFNNRNTALTLQHIKPLAAYIALIDKCYAEAIPIIDKQIRSMLQDVKVFTDPPYEIVTLEDIGKRIGYKTLDCVDTNISYGYRTSFAYLYEATRHADIRAIANEQLALQIPCGSYSFADVPISHFQCIMGVTGTLSCLSAAERDIVQNDYKITKMTITPSIYGDSKLTFKKDGDVILEEDIERYNQTILKEIQDERGKGRPVLVFFETENELRQFERSDYGQRIDDMNVVTEKTSNVAFYVTKATSLGTVTLFPKVFGRGLDFVCRDVAVDAAGGVHVIQTFFSDYTSEEIQIKGRTARQSKKGSYKLILFRDQLTKLGLTADQIHNAYQSNTFYDQLQQPREQSISKQVQELRIEADKCKNVHEKSTKFIGHLLSPSTSLDKIVKSILSFDASGAIQPTHLIFCLDESGSMTYHWPHLVNACKEFLKIRVQNGANNDIVSIIQFSSNARTTIKRKPLLDLVDNLNLDFGDGGTYFVPALTMANQIVSHDASQMDIVMVFMTDGDTSDVQPSIQYCNLFQPYYNNGNFQFFGVAFNTSDATLRQMSSAVHGSDSAASDSVVSAANVNDLQTKFQFIAQEATTKQSRR